MSKLNEIKTLNLGKPGKPEIEPQVEKVDKERIMLKWENVFAN